LDSFGSKHADEKRKKKEENRRKSKQ